MFVESLSTWSCTLLYFSLALFIICLLFHLLFISFSCTLGSYSGNHVWCGLFLFSLLLMHQVSLSLHSPVEVHQISCQLDGTETWWQGKPFRELGFIWPYNINVPLCIMYSSPKLTLSAWLSLSA